MLTFQYYETVKMDILTIASRFEINFALEWFIAMLNKIHYQEKNVCPSSSKDLPRSNRTRNERRAHDGINPLTCFETHPFSNLTNIYRLSGFACGPVTTSLVSL